MSIHPSAIVCDGAVLGADVEVGPFCYVGPHVTIGDGCRLLPHCYIDGYTTLGKRNTVHPFAALGGPAQDHDFLPGTVSYLQIGDDNIFREGCVIHAGTKEGSSTIIGNRNMFMNSTHVAHNCHIWNDVIFVNFAGSAGYGEVFDHAILSGLTGLHQFCRVGRYCMISGGSVFSKDIPPFMIAEGRNGGVKTINRVGLMRAGFSSETIEVIKHIHRIYYRSGLSPVNALAKIRTDLPQIPEVLEFLDFCANTKKGVLAAGVEGHRC